MALPLPYVITEDTDAEALQGNFDALRKAFPLSRKHMGVEDPHTVGDAGEPAFENGWVNYDTATYRGLRFWKDPMGVVRVEGVVATGAVPATIFTLPAGYRPGNGLIFPNQTNTGAGRVDVAATGNVVAQSGGSTYFSVNLFFKQEQ